MTSERAEDNDPRDQTSRSPTWDPIHCWIGIDQFEYHLEREVLTLKERLEETGFSVSRCRGIERERFRGDEGGYKPCGSGIFAPGKIVFGLNSRERGRNDF